VEWSPPNMRSPQGRGACKGPAQYGRVVMWLITPLTLLLHRPRDDAATEVLRGAERRWNSGRPMARARSTARGHMAGQIRPGGSVGAQTSLCVPG